MFAYVTLMVDECFKSVFGVQVISVDIFFIFVYHNVLCIIVYYCLSSCIMYYCILLLTIDMCTRLSNDIPSNAVSQVREGLEPVRHYQNIFTFFFCARVTHSPPGMCSRLKTYYTF